MNDKDDEGVNTRMRKGVTMQRGGNNDDDDKEEWGNDKKTTMAKRAEMTMTSDEVGQ